MYVVWTRLYCSRFTFPNFYKHTDKHTDTVVIWLVALCFKAHSARLICRLHIRRIRWSCWGLTSVTQQIRWIYFAAFIVETYVWRFRVPAAISPCCSATVVKPYGLGYWHRAPTLLFFRIANGGLQGSHLKVPSNGASMPAWAPRMRALPKLSIKAVHTATRGSLFG